MISEDGFFLPSVLPSSSSISDSGFAVEELNYPNPNPNPETPAGNNKRKRNLPRSPNPEVEVVAMSPKTLMTTNRFICEICNKGFQRDQNLQLHRRGHNLPWKLKQKANKEQVKKKVYICPEKSCVHHDPSRALGDLTGIKKHFSRKHGEKKWKCDKCSKKYAVMSDWKAHSKICGTREYKCDCGTIFSRKDSFITHRAFCDALTEERVRVNTNTIASSLIPNMGHEMIGFIAGDRSSEINIPSFSASQRPDFLGFESLASTNLGSKSRLPLWIDMNNHVNPSSSIGGSGSGHLLPEFSPSLFTSSSSFPQPLKEEEDNRVHYHAPEMISLYSMPSSSTGNMSATALLQKAAQIGSSTSNNNNNSTIFTSSSRQLFRQHMNDQLIANNDGMRDFLGTLGGEGARTDVGEDERRVILQEEMTYTMARSQDHHQEPYKDLMS